MVDLNRGESWSGTFWKDLTGRASRVDMGELNGIREEVIAVIQAAEDGGPDQSVTACVMKLGKWTKISCCIGYGMCEEKRTAEGNFQGGF